MMSTQEKNYTCLQCQQNIAEQLFTWMALIKWSFLQSREWGLQNCKSGNLHSYFNDLQITYSFARAKADS